MFAPVEEEEEEEEEEEMEEVEGEATKHCQLSGSSSDGQLGAFKMQETGNYSQIIRRCSSSFLIAAITQIMTAAGSLSQ